MTGVANLMANQGQSKTYTPGMTQSQQVGAQNFNNSGNQFLTNLGTSMANNYQKPQSLTGNQI